MSHDDLDLTPAKPSWQERERNLALQRLANARANLAGLQEQALAPVSALAAADPEDVERVESIEEELGALQVKANARFGGSAARERIAELEYKQRLIFERIGVSSYDEFVARRDSPVPAVDDDVLAFAQREFDDAMQAFLDIANLEMPDVEPDDDAIDLDGEDAEIINLNVKPAAS